MLKIYFKKINYIIIASMLFLPAGTRAFNLDDLMAEYEEIYYYDSESEGDGADITNNIKTSAKAGGNTAGNGAVIDGTAQAEIEIRTEINGETVADINLKPEVGDSVDLKIENQVKADGNKVQAEISDTPPTSYNLSPLPAGRQAPLIRGGTGRGVAEPVLDELFEKQEESVEGGLCSLSASVCTGSDDINPEDKQIDDGQGIVVAWLGFLNAIKAGILKIFSFSF